MSTMSTHVPHVKVSVEADPDMDVELQQPWADASDADRLKVPFLLLLQSSYSYTVQQMSAVCFLFARSLQQLWQEVRPDFRFQTRRLEFICTYFGSTARQCLRQAVP